MSTFFLFFSFFSFALHALGWSRSLPFATKLPSPETFKPLQQKKAQLKPEKSSDETPDDICVFFFSDPLLLAPPPSNRPPLCSGRLLLLSLTFRCLLPARRVERRAPMNARLQLGMATASLGRSLSDTERKGRASSPTKPKPNRERRKVLSALPPFFRYYYTFFTACASS